MGGVLLIGGQLVKSHPRKSRGKETHSGDYPPENIAFLKRTPGQAAEAGCCCSARPAEHHLSAELLTENALYRPRAAEGVIGLAKQAWTCPGPRWPARGKGCAGPGARSGGILGRRDFERARSGPPAAGDGGALRVPAKPGVVRERHPPARYDPPSDAVAPGPLELSTVTTLNTVQDRNALASALRDLQAFVGDARHPSMPASPRPAPAECGPPGLPPGPLPGRDQPPPVHVPVPAGIRRARFETEATFEGFDFHLFAVAQGRPLFDARRPALAGLRGDSVALKGLNGFGKGPGPGPPRPVRAGAEARFTKTSRVLAYLRRRDAQTAPGTSGSPERTTPPSWSWTDFPMCVEPTATQADDPTSSSPNARASRSS